MSFLNGAVQRRDWNLVLGAGVAPLLVYFGYTPVPAPIQTPSGPALVQNAAFLASLTTYGTITFTGFGFGSLFQSQNLPLVGATTGNVVITYLPNTAGTIVVRTSSGSGRYNTTAVGVEYIDCTGTTVSSITWTPVQTNFNSFGLYMTDAGDFLPAEYGFIVQTNLQIRTGLFSLAKYVPTPDGNLVFWGFNLTTGETIVSVTMTLPGATSDFVGIDDIVFGRTP